MTQEEFIKILKRKKYSYEIEGDKIIVTHKGSVHLKLLTSLPSDVEFRNVGNVYLDSLTGGAIIRCEGNIEGIDSKRLLNVMIKRGMFI